MVQGVHLGLIFPHGKICPFKLVGQILVVGSHESNFGACRLVLRLQEFAFVAEKTIDGNANGYCDNKGFIQIGGNKSAYHWGYH